MSFIFRQIFKTLIKKISENSIKEYLHDIVSGLLLSLKEEIFSIKLSAAWNALEHMATRYWIVNNEAKLYTIKKEKFDILVEKINEIINLFLENEVKEEDINIEKQYWDKWDYKQLIKGHLTNNINQFSPIKYKIKVMLQDQDMSIDDKLIKEINDVRNWIFHYGYTYEEIESKLGSSPKNLLIRFIFTIYEKILKFIGIVNEFAEFYGNQILFHNFHEDKKKMEEEINKIITAEQDKFNIRNVNEIDTINKKLKDLTEEELSAKFKWRNIECELLIKISKDLTKIYLPKGFPDQYFNILRKNKSLPIDSEGRNYNIENASLICENMEYKIIFKVDCRTNKTGNIKEIILSTK